MVGIEIASRRVGARTATPLHASAFADALASDAPSPITYDTPPAASVLAEDREIQAYPIRIPRDHIRIIPVGSIFE